MKHLLFSPQMKLADLLPANYKLLLVFDRFRIPLGFGDKSVKDVCTRYDIPLSLFLIVCNVYSFEDYLPEKDELQSFKADSLIDYLKNSHRYYTEECLPGISRKLDSISDSLDLKYGTALREFYNVYQNEVLNHFNYEEEVAFPYIKQLSEGIKSDQYNIGQFEKNHSDIDEKLNDLKNIIIKYLPVNSPSDQLNALLIELFELEDDFMKHTLIENKILVPLVAQLEKQL